MDQGRHRERQRVRELLNGRSLCMNLKEHTHTHSTHLPVHFGSRAEKGHSRQGKGWAETLEQ